MHAMRNPSGCCELRRYALLSAAAWTITVASCTTQERWTQWGGEHQDFKSSSTGLADSWPEAGPAKLWERELGEGYSGILADGNRLYTMYASGDEEVVVALSAKNGDTLWEHKYPSTPHEDHVTQFGTGPRSTPLLSGGRLYTVGISGTMHCLSAKTGKVIWTHHLWKEFDYTFLQHGYASSPIAYKDTVIVPVGGEGHSFVAFDKKDGHLVWQNQSFSNSYSTPKLINIDGEDQLVCFMATEIVGFDPNNGALKWQYPLKNQWGQNVCMPAWGDDNHLVFSTPQAGSRGVKLARNGDKTDVQELWSTRKIQFYHTTAVRVGDYVYGSSGTRAPCFFSAINVKTGKIAWRERGFAKATCVYADGRFIILDEDGHLALATATPEGLTVHSKVQLLDKVSWTVPTVVGTTLYVRDKTTIMALDLS